ncbi:MAG TPA: universal stress protein [Rhodothermales bacterium]|nr:universal stress protein [Rhodothermales bacterium]
MVSVKKILFPTDFSICAERAFGHAAYLADQYGAEVHLLHVIETYGTDASPLIEDTVISEEDIAEQLHVATGVARQTPTDEGVHIIQVQRHGASPSAVILDYAQEQDMDLIVMGTQGRRGVDRLLAGSVAEEVVRLSPCPVFTVRTGKDPVPRRAVRTILVPIDLSEHSRAALRYARDLAASYEAHLEVVHVIEEEVMPVVYGLDAVAPPTEQVHRQAAEALHNLIAEEVGAEQVATTITVGHPAAEVLAYAKAHEVDLIVIATHGRTGLKHFLMGSVAEKVVRMAPCPVFTVKSFGKVLVPQEQATAVEDAQG